MEQQGGSPSAQPRTALGVASFVLGLVALLTSFLPIFNNFSALMALVGLILGIIGVVSVMRKTRTGRSLAIAGVVLCAVSIVVVLASQAFYGAVLDSAFGAETGFAGSPAALTAPNGGEDF